jgi:membrane protein DedA with SNARE-associated domain
VLASWLTSWLEEWLQNLSGPWLYVVAFLMTFAETGTLLFFIPGEFTLLLAGAAAGAGNLSLPLMIVVAIAGALLGDFTGFHLGARYGNTIKSSWLGRRMPEKSWAKSEDLIKRRKGLIVLVGRWIGFLRAIMPASAGMSGMTYRTFLPWDIAGAVSWASLCVVAGYLVGDNFKKIETWIGRGGLFVMGALLIVFVVRHFTKKKEH